jgi:hypothetical protein
MESQLINKETSHTSRPLGRSRLRSCLRIKASIEPLMSSFY